MPFCAIKWCGNNSGTSNYSKDGVTFHRFPKTPETKEAWINACRKDNWFPTNNSVICSRHFTSDSFQYLKNNRRRLFQTAIPTVDIPGLISAQQLNAEMHKQDQKSGYTQSSPRLENTSEYQKLFSQVANSIASPKSSRVTDLPIEDLTPRERIMKRRIDDLSSSLKKKNIKLKRLQDKTRILKKKVANLKEIVDTLSKKSLTE